MAMRTVAIVAALAVAATAPGADAKVRRQGPMTLDGSCDFTGTVTFRPPLTNETRAVAQHARAPGRCSGTLTDRRGRRHALKNARVRYVADTRPQPVSCLLGTPTGAGALVFRWGRLGFTMRENRAGALATLILGGTRGGSALVAGAPPPSEDPGPLLEACAGPGIKRVTLSGHVQTTRTLSG